MVKRGKLRDTHPETSEKGFQKIPRRIGKNPKTHREKSQGASGKIGNRFPKLLKSISKKSEKGFQKIGKGFLHILPMFCVIRDLKQTNSKSSFPAYSNRQTGSVCRTFRVSYLCKSVKSVSSVCFCSLVENQVEIRFWKLGILCLFSIFHTLFSIKLRRLFISISMR